MIWGVTRRKEFDQEARLARIANAGNLNDARALMKLGVVASGHRRTAHSAQRTANSILGKHTADCKTGRT